MPGAKIIAMTTLENVYFKSFMDVHKYSAE